MITVRAIVPLIFLLMAILLLIKTFVRSRLGDIEVIELTDLCKIWIDNPSVDEVLTPIKIEDESEIKEIVSEDIINMSDLVVEEEITVNITESFLSLIREKINIVNSSNELDVITFNESVYILRGTVLKIADELHIDEEVLIAELIKCEIARSSYKLYKYFYDDSLKPDVKKTLVIKIDEWMEQYESRKGKDFKIKNIEEVIKSK